MPPKKNLAISKAQNSSRDDYMKKLNATVAQQAKSISTAKPIIHNRTPIYSNPKQLKIINDNAVAYQKVLKSQSMNNNRNAIASQNSLQQSHPNVDFRDPMWYQKHFASPINGPTNHENAMSYARPLDYVPPQENYSYDNNNNNYNDNNNSHYNYQNDNLQNDNLQRQVNNIERLLSQMQTQLQLQTQTQSQSQSQLQSHSLINTREISTRPEIKAIQKTPKYYKSSDNSKFIDNSLINESKYLLKEINSLKQINENLKNEIFILSSKYDIEIQMNDKIEIMNITDLTLNQQVNILREYIQLFNNSNKEISEQIKNINNIFN